MYDVCAQPGDCTTNAHAHAKTARAAGSLPLPIGTTGGPDLRSVRIGLEGYAIRATALFRSG
jgi:hypothetical protein